MYLPARSFAAFADKVSVNAVLLQELGMGALLHNLAAVYDDDLIGSLYGFQPMSNHDNGLFGGKRVDGAHQLVFIFGIDVGSCLIQKDDRCVFHHGAGNRDALFFSAGKTCAAFTDYRIVSVGKA